MARRVDWTAFVLFSVVYWVFWYSLLLVTGMNGGAPQRYLPIYVALVAIPYAVTALIVAPWWPRHERLPAAATTEPPPSSGEKWAARIIFGSMLVLFWLFTIAGLSELVRVVLGVSPPPSSGPAYLLFEVGAVTTVAALLTASGVRSWREYRAAAVGGTQRR